MAQKLLGSRLLANSGWFNERATASGWFFGELVADVSSGGSPVDPVLVTSVTSSATGNVTTSYSQALASTTTGDLNIIAINVSPQANLTDPGVPTIDGTAVDTTPGNTAGGWTTIGTAWDSGSPGPRMTVVYRVRQAGDPSSVTIAWSSVGNYATVVSAFQAGTFDTSTPVEQAAIQNQATTSTSFPLPSMTTTVRGSALYFASNRSTGTWTMPGTLINHAENASTANIATAYDTAAAAHTESPTATHTASTGAGNTAIASLKSKPASGATQNAQADLTSTPATDAAALATKPVTGDLTSTPVVTATGTTTKPVTATGITQTPTVAAATTAVKPVAGDLTSTPATAAAGSVTKPVTGDLTVTPSTAAAASVVKPIAAALTSTPVTDATAAIGSATQTAQGDLTVTPSTTAAATVVKPLGAALTVTPATAAAAAKTIPAAAPLTLTPTTAAALSRTAIAAAVLTLTITTTAAGDVTGASTPQGGRAEGGPGAGPAIRELAALAPALASTPPAASSTKGTDPAAPAAGGAAPTTPRAGG